MQCHLRLSVGAERPTHLFCLLPLLFHRYPWFRDPSRLWVWQKKATWMLNCLWLLTWRLQAILVGLHRVRKSSGEWELGCRLCQRGSPAPTPLPFFSSNKQGQAIVILSDAISRLHRHQLPSMSCTGHASVSFSKPDGRVCCYLLTARLSDGVEDMFEHVAPFMPFVARIFLCNLWLFRPVVEVEKTKTRRSTENNSI